MLLPLWKKVPVKRIVSLSNLREGATLTLTYDAASGRPLPPGVTSPQIATYSLTGITDLAAKYNATGKYNAHFTVSRSGLVALEKARGVALSSFDSYFPPPRGFPFFFFFGVWVRDPSLPHIFSHSSPLSLFSPIRVGLMRITIPCISFD